MLKSSQHGCAICAESRTRYGQELQLPPAIADSAGLPGNVFDVQQFVAKKFPEGDPLAPVSQENLG
jgi:hypothetical protein